MIGYRLLGGSDVAPFVDAIRDLYAEVFAEPPYCEGPEDVARFVEHLADETTRDGFALTQAMDGPLLVGVAYGWTMPPGRWFRSPAGAPPPEIVDVPHFAIMEWMVRASHRGAGVGRRLLDLLLEGRPEPWAVLAANPQAPARRVYERLGWRMVGASQPDGGRPGMDTLALPLPTSR
jgi:GNAT superfamily N-acetyltransferase